MKKQSKQSNTIKKDLAGLRPKNYWTICFPQMRFASSCPYQVSRITPLLQRQESLCGQDATVQVVTEIKQGKLNLGKQAVLVCIEHAIILAISHFVESFKQPKPTELERLVKLISTPELKKGQILNSNELNVAFEHDEAQRLLSDLLNSNDGLDGFGMPESTF